MREAIHSMPRKDAWTRDETILALDLYFRCDRKQPKPWDENVIELSNFLRQLKLIPESERKDSFRNPDGVSMKIGNLSAFDPESTARGLNHGTSSVTIDNIEYQVWNDFGTNPQLLSKVANAIWAAGLDSVPLQVNALIGELDDDEYPEGKLLTHIHLIRERNPKVVAAKKREVLSKKGNLACEVCDFDFAEFYGIEIGHGFAECHHIEPLADLEPDTKTKISDLAIVCANCHRMLHTARPVLTVEALRAIVMDRRSHRES